MTMNIDLDKDSGESGQLTERTKSKTKFSNSSAESSNKASIFRDSRVRLMGLAAAGLVIFYLVLIVSAIMLGVIGSKTPQTLSEKNLLLSRTKVEQGSRLEKDWADYANALLATGQYARAQTIIDQAKKAKILDPSKRWLDIAQSRSYLLQKQYAKAVKAAQVGMDGIVNQYKKDMAAYRKTGKPTALTADGVGENYYTMLLIKAESLEQLKKHKDAIKALTGYLSAYPTAADILEWRGDLFRQTGADAKAIKDYRSAVKYVADKTELNTKIEEIGADNE